MKSIMSYTKLGFKIGGGSVHVSRTIMLKELKLLLTHVNNPVATKREYLSAIIDTNCLAKRSSKTRFLTSRHLAELYSLDVNNTLFRSLLFFWHRDTNAHPLLALLCAYSRDPLLREVVPFILNHQHGAIIDRQALECKLDSIAPGRFSKATLQSTAQNINSTLTKSGHLVGKAKKNRALAVATEGSVAYALCLGYLTGSRGQELLRTEYAKLLDCSYERIIDLAEEASRRGWITFKRVGTVIEILFPLLINAQEME